MKAVEWGADCVGLSKKQKKTTPRFVASFVMSLIIKELDIDLVDIRGWAG
jgi:hypothetical protein